MNGMLPLDELSHAELFLRRMMPGADQSMLGPAEHRAFAREFAQESPLKAAVSLPFAIPAYTGAKAMGLMGARSPASWAEMMGGYRGMFEGLGLMRPPRRGMLPGVDGTLQEMPPYPPLPKASGGVRG